jgi:hypothetical protein
MFAPQTIPASPAVLMYRTPKEILMYFLIQEMLPLPRPLFPVYRFFCAASVTGLRSLGCLIHASRVGH